ncbi:MAG TPA: DUF6152 family protein [Candidatus Acidoferrales bacterium]|nr:DUF6152 family protein [Candidatus Acidoferrales bacterium]
MKRVLTGGFIVGLVLILVSGPAFAHHGTSRYDLTKTITLDGVVTGFEWGNPHCLVHLDVTGDNGEVQHWTIELASPFTMSHEGWNKDTLRTGDKITVETHPASNGIPLGISASSRTVMKFVVNGKPLPGQ